ncbi:MAG: phytase [Alphaproteobacteria bacterium]|nr:MAG: phytase [Alphaproteobacteria bacterium]
MFQSFYRPSGAVIAAMLASGVAACSPASDKSTSAPAVKVPASVAASGETTPSANDKAAQAVLWQAADGSNHIFGAVKRGLESYDGTGTRTGTFGTGEIEGVGLIQNFNFAGARADLLLALDTRKRTLSGFRLDPATPGAAPEPVAGGVTAGRLLEGMCAYTSGLDGRNYAFLLGSDGIIEQWQISIGKDGSLGGNLTRTLQLGTEPKFCVADAFDNSLYVTEEAVGIWQFDANPEAEVVPNLVDVHKFGNIEGEVDGLALVRDGAGHAALVAGDAGAGKLNVYDINAGHAFMGAVNLVAGGSVDAADDIGDGISFGAGLLLVADGNNEGEGANFKLARWADVDKALSLSGKLVANTNRPVEFGFKPVEASVETAPVASGGDAADDPAVWVNAKDPAKSLIIGTNKQGGLYSYGLDGAVHQYLEIGRVNNVDIRYGVKIGGETMTLVTTTNRTSKSISVLKMDEATGLMSDVADGVQATGMSDPYGMCMYQSAKTGKTYVFANDKDGETSQWELVEGAKGRVKINLVRQFEVGTTAEGCVADDETGAYYSNEEDVALWKYGAEPEDGDARTMITSVESNPALKDDLEGVSIYYGEGGTGYIVLSSQGNNSYAVLDRQAPHAYRGSFAVVAGDGTGIDGSSETDGLDVTAAPMGPAFPHGAFIAQDGRNIAPQETQNFKLVPWERIAEALGLDTPSDRPSR